MQISWMTGDDENDADVEMPVEEDEEMDDMPPLVDHPGASAMTYTFIPEDMPETSPTVGGATDFTSMGGPYSEFTVNLDRDLAEAPRGRTLVLTTEPYHPHLPDPTGYIPRPPNAFILFRSAFIRSQKITGKVEGNHSTLSKIIGMCWRKLTSNERAEWEEKARIAQEEHRRRYPDWRFSPASNATASAARRGKRGRRGGFIASDGRSRGVRRKGRETSGVGDPDEVDLDPGGVASVTPGRTSRKRRMEQQNDEDYDEDEEDEAPIRNSERGVRDAEETMRTRAGPSSRSKGKGKVRAPQIMVSIPDTSSISPLSPTFPADPSSTSGSGLSTSTSGSSISIWRTPASPAITPFRKSRSMSVYQAASSSGSVIPVQSSKSLSPYASSVSPSPSTSGTPSTASPISSPGVAAGPANAESNTPDQSDNSAISEPERNKKDKTNVAARSRRPRSSTVPTPTTTSAVEPVSASKGRYNTRSRKSQEQRVHGRGRWNSNPLVPTAIHEDTTSNDCSAAERSPDRGPSSTIPSVPSTPQRERISSPNHVSSGSVVEHVSDRGEPGHSDVARDDDQEKDREREKEKEQRRSERRIQHIAALLQAGKEGVELEQVMVQWDEDEDRKMAEEYDSNHGDTEGHGRDTVTDKRSLSPEHERGSGHAGMTARACEDDTDKPHSHPVSQTSSIAPTPTNAFNTNFCNSDDSDTDTETLRGRAGGDWSLSRYSPIRESATFQSRHREELSGDQEELPVPHVQPMNSFSTETTASNLPLTHMFKRSLSEPASRARVPFPLSTSQSGIVSEQEGVVDVRIDVLGTEHMDVHSERSVVAEAVDVNSFIWPPPPSPLPAHAVSVPDPHTKVQAIPPNTRAYTHPNVSSRLHHRLSHPSLVPISRPYAPFASSPLSLSPSPGSPSNFSPVSSSVSPASAPAYQYATTPAPPYSEQMYAHEQQDMDQSRMPYLHYDYSTRSHLYAHSLQMSESTLTGAVAEVGSGPRAGMNFATAGRPDPGTTTEISPQRQSPRTIRTRSSHSHLVGQYHGEYKYLHPQQYPAMSPSPRPPPSPELQQDQTQEQESRSPETQSNFASYSTPSHFPRRGSIALPIGSPFASSRSTGGPDIVLGSVNRARHRRSSTWQDFDQVRRQETSPCDDVQGDGTNPGVTTDENAQAKYKSPSFEELMSTQTMGYIVENSQVSSTFSQDQVLLPDDGPQPMQWSSASHGRVGLVNTIMDPYMKHNFDSYERDGRQNVVERVVPSSTYSSLRGWAGDSDTLLRNKEQSSSSSLTPGVPPNSRGTMLTSSHPYGEPAFAGKLDGIQPMSVAASAQPELGFSDELVGRQIASESEYDSTRDDANWRHYRE